MPSNPVDEWSVVRDQFEALVRERSDNIENLLDAEFRHRFGKLLTRVAERETYSAKQRTIR